MKKIYKKEEDIFYGRRPIRSQERTRSFSKRAYKGDLDVIEKKCKFCNHKKMFINQSANGKYGSMKCCKCGRINI